MAGEVASAFVSLMPSARGFGRSSERQIGPQMTGVAQRTGRRFGKVFAYASMSPLKAIGAAAIGLFAVAKVKQFFQGAIAEAREAQKVSAITAQVIKSTGGAANISAGQVGRLAENISRLTGIDDEAIQSGSNLLLTFKNLRNEAGRGNDVFNQATRIITDMSVALGTDVKGSAIQVGKALNDPIKGISALTRVGVTFTDAQKEQITALSESGKRLHAQKIILRELRSEFGGTAAAAATAGDRFKVAFANFQESVGTALLPYLDRLLLKGVEVIGFLQNDVPRAFDAFKNAAAPVVAVVREFVEDHLPAFKTALSALAGAGISSLISLIGGGLVSALVTVASALVSPIALAGALVGAAIYAYTHFEGFRTAVDNVVASLRANLVPVFQSVVATIQTQVIPAIIQFAGYFRSNILPALQQFGSFIVTQVIPIIGQIAGFILTKFYPAMIQIWATVAQRLRPVFDQLVATFRSDVLPTLTLAANKFREWWPTIQRVIEVATKLYGKWLEFQATIAGKVLPVVIRFAGFLLSTVVPAVISYVESTAKIIAKLIEFGRAVVDRIQDVARFVKGVKEKFGEAVAFVTGIPGKIADALSSGLMKLYNIGKDLIQGFINGIKSMASSVIDAAKGVVHGAIDGAKSLLKIGSPSKVFHQIGGWTIQGLADGIIAGTPAAVSAATDAATKVQAAILDRLTSMRDGVKGILDGLRSDFASLRGSVASAFTGDLFSATNATDFLTGLTSTRLNIAAITRAFHKLARWGLPPNFLAQMIQSGNGALILDLANGARVDARNAATEFGAIQSLSNQLGGAVARDSYGPRIDRISKQLDDLTRAVKQQGREFGRELNKVGVAAGQRR